MVAIVCASQQGVFLEYLVRKNIYPIPYLFVLLGASWYYYLRVLGKYTPGFTTLGSILFVVVFSMSNWFCEPYTRGGNYLSEYILVSSAFGLGGIAVFAVAYYISRTDAQRKARRKQVSEIWKQDAKLIKKLAGKKK